MNMQNSREYKVKGIQDENTKQIRASVTAIAASKAERQI